MKNLLNINDLSKDEILKIINAAIDNKKNNKHSIQAKDKTLAKAKKYNVKILKIKKFFPGKAINLGFKQAKGKYLIFLDSDDFLLKNSLEQLKKTIEKNNFPEVILNNCERNRVPQNYNHLLKYFDNKIYTNNNFFKILNKNRIILNECWSLIISNKMIKKNKVFFKNIKII